MINESELWKKVLVKIAKKLLHRVLQKKWSDASIFNLEKELFIGFFIVRKLIESEDLSKELVGKKYEFPFFPANSLMIEGDLPYIIDKALKKKLSLREISNQFIHSFHLIPFGANGIMIGFLVNSDYHSKNGIYLITIFGIVEIYRLCAGTEGILDNKKK